MHVLLVEPDRRIAKLLSDELTAAGVQKISQAQTANQAIAIADTHKPDVVISELALAGHSGSEFLYEFRTYPDWKHVRVITYSTLHLSAQIQNSNDWQLLDIEQAYYKPDISIQALIHSVIKP